MTDRQAPDDDDALDALLRHAAPPPLADDGFVARTMAAVDQTNRTLPARRRAAPRSPAAIARALVAEEQRHAAQARRWRWGIAGVTVGYLLMLLAMATSPSGLSLSLPSQWLPLSLVLCAGAFWTAWRSLRSL